MAASISNIELAGHKPVVGKPDTRLVIFRVEYLVDGEFVKRDIVREVNFADPQVAERLFTRVDAEIQEWKEKLSPEKVIKGVYDQLLEKYKARGVQG